MLSPALMKECRQRNLGVFWVDAAGRALTVPHDEHVARYLVQDRITALLTKNFHGTLLPMHLLSFESDWLHRATVLDAHFATAAAGKIRG